MDKIELRVDVSESDIPKVQLGDSAVIDVEAYNNQKFKGVVTQIANSNNGASTESDQANSSTDVTNYKVYIRILPESYSNLVGRGSFPFRPGMNASADIQTKTHLNVLSVPINAVTPRDKNDTLTADKKTDDNLTVNTSSTDSLELVVFILDTDNEAKKVEVSTGIQDINYIEITDGLQEGQEVITGPYDVVSKTLKQKDKVKVVDKKDLFNKN